MNMKYLWNIQSQLHVHVHVSTEDVLCYRTGSLVLDIFRGPIQIVIGLLYGVLSGLLLWIIPTKSLVSFVLIWCDA